MIPDASEPVISRPPGRVDRIGVPATLLDTTIAGLSLGRDCEMLCYWIGAALPPDAQGRTRAHVISVAFPRIISGYDYFRVADGQVAQITERCARSSLWVIAQVHTHPTDEPHSEADECGPVSHRAGFVSVVLPFFAQFSTVRDPHWRTHVLGQHGAWSEVDPDSCLEVIADVWLPESPEDRA
jgi:hypothetical protein